MISMAINLYEHQRKALEMMKNGCILCGGVGSGKSRTGLAYYFTQNDGQIGEDFLPMRNSPQDLYIITTARKRDTHEWEGELVPFAMTVDEENRYYDHKVVIDSWNNIKKYANVTDSFFIFDEDRVTGSGIWAKTFIKIAKTNNWIVLSATPGDTWSDYIPVFVANGFYKNRTEFLNAHAVYNRMYTYKIDKYVDTSKLMKYRNSILVDMDFVRSTESHHEKVYSEYDIQEYKDLMRYRWNKTTEKPIESAAELCYALRKVANSHESRVKNAIEIVKCKKKVIIFYNFDYELDILRENFSKIEGLEVAEWNGHKHQNIPNSDFWIYLVQYTAGAEGWNCVTTDSMIFFSQNYSYKVMIQAQGRIDRLNTPFTDLYYYHLKSHAPIDLAISRALNTKKEFNERRFLENYA